MADPEHLKVARNGKNTWDTWRRAHPSERADFTGTDFTAVENREVVFSGFEFEGGVDFTDCIFADTPIPYQKYGSGPRVSPNGAALFDGAVFRDNACFRRARFGHNARFDGAVFEKAADFADATFLNGVKFSAAVFGAAGFSYARFGDHARFDGALFVDRPSFESAVFGDNATFEGASFGQAFFYMSRFGHEADFSASVFAAKDMAVQFNAAAFGDNARFNGAAFECRAYFNEAEFGDRAFFEARDEVASKDAAAVWARVLPERYRDLYSQRVNASDSRSFHDITFSSARFGEEAVGRYGSESLVDRIRLFPRRLLHSPDSHRRGALAPGPGASFRGRVLKGVCDFSRVRFDQPPDFAGVEQTDNLDLSGATFSCRGAAWPRWRHWTTSAETATRIRRLRKLASDIRAEYAERELLALERTVTLGLEWSIWWSDVVLPWDYHRMMRPTGGDDARPTPPVRTKWLRRVGASTWSAIRGVGRPAVWTVLTFLYRVLSDFGRSVALPSLWFLASLVGFGVWYGMHATPRWSVQSAQALAAFTLANAVPFVSSSRKALDDSVAVLFPNGIPIPVHAVGILNGLVSAVLLFLIIFAVRNRFRIG